MKKTLLAMFAVLALATMAFAAAQGHGHGHGYGHGPGHGPEMMAKMEEHLATALDLTAEQKAALKQLHAEMRTKAEPLMEQQRKQREELHALLESDNPDPAAVGNKAIAAHEAGEQLEALHDDLAARFSALLTEEQKAKFNEIKEKHHRGPGFGHGEGF